jgi:hypothetical protein
MPSTLVVMRQGGNTNEVDVVDSSSGAVVRRLYDASTVDALATHSTYVYLSTPKGILRVPRMGGTPVRITSDVAQMMAVSPNGRHLAWAENSWPGGVQNHHVSIVSFTIMDLQTGATRTWALPPQSDLNPIGAPPIYQVRSLTWRTNDQLAAIAFSTRIWDVPTCAIPPRGTTPPSNCTSSRGTHPPDLPHLLLIDTRSKANPRALSIPSVGFPFTHLSNPDLLIPGPRPGTLMAAIYPDPNGPGGSGHIVELIVTGTRVAIKPMNAIAPFEQALSLDTNRRDLLLINTSDTPPYKQTLQRSTDGKPPAQIGVPGTSYSAAW